MSHEELFLLARLSYVVDQVLDDYELQSPEDRPVKPVIMSRSLMRELRRVSQLDHAGIQAEMQKPAIDANVKMNRILADCPECQGGSDTYYNTPGQERDAPCSTCGGTGTDPDLSYEELEIQVDLLQKECRVRAESFHHIRVFLEAVRNDPEGDRFVRKSILEVLENCEWQIAEQAWLDSLEIAENRLIELTEAIMQHRNQHADDLCWMDDNKLYEAAGLSPRDNTVGDPCAMLENCKRFIEQRCQTGGNWKSYAELEKELSELKSARNVEKHDFESRPWEMAIDMAKSPDSYQRGALGREIGRLLQTLGVAP